VSDASKRWVMDRQQLSVWRWRFGVGLRFSSSQFDQFRREVAIMERLNHPYVIRLHSAYEDEAYLYIAMGMEL
jgi:serine/threonine protein kinase